MNKLVSVFTKFYKFTGVASSSEYATGIITLTILDWSLVIFVANKELESLISLTLFFLIFSGLAGTSLAVRRLRGKKQSAWWVIVHNVLFPLSFFFLISKTKEEKEYEYKFKHDYEFLKNKK